MLFKEKFNYFKYINEFILIIKSLSIVLLSYSGRSKIDHSKIDAVKGTILSGF